MDSFPLQHALSEPLSLAGSQSQAQWALNCPRKAVIFVHGFCGAALKTWTHFPDLLTLHPGFGDCDLIYYGYDAKFKQANSSALDFRDFLTALLSRPFAHANQALQNFNLPELLREEHGTYEKIVIIAHSLGAIVSRVALLDCHDLRQRDAAKYAWLDRCRLVLFAPAHWGSMTADIAYLFLSNQSTWILSDIAGKAALQKSPLLGDLRSNSAVIEQLRERTAELLKAAAPPPYAIAEAVRWADIEAVVHNSRFGRDAVAEKIPGTDHVSVCKPDTSDHLAVQVLAETILK